MTASTPAIALGRSGAGALVRREHARSLGADVVVALFRLVKLTQLHDLDNQATQRQLEELEKLVHEYGLEAGCDVNILFARRAVFLAGQLLRASRTGYEAATELGETLERLGGSELTVARDVTVAELRAFAEAIAAALRDRVAFRSPTSKIRLRAVNDAARVRGLEVETLPPEARVVRTYASAVVLLRRFFERLAAGDYAPPARLKRIAQSLVDLSTGGAMAFLRVTEARNANFDEAGRSVNTAILAVAVAREVTTDRALLAQIAMASMMLDAGRPRAAAAGAGDGTSLSSVVAELTEEQLQALPAGTAAVLTALGRLNDATVRRTVVAYEALSLRYRRAAGTLYGGVHPATLHARIVALCRRYNDLLTPEPGLAPPTPDAAVAALHRALEAPADRTVLRMLAAALGLLPPGTVVRLSSGEVGEVVATPGPSRGAMGRPRVRIALDAHGGLLEPPRELDLSAPDVDPALRVESVVSVTGWGEAREEPRARASSEPPSTHSGVSAVRPTTVTPKPAAVKAPLPAAVGPVDGAELTVVRRPQFDEPEERTTFSPPSDRKVLVRHGDTPGEATARGNLAATPLVQLLVYMLDHRLAGTLVLREPDGVESSVVFASGGPVKVSSGRPVARLGELLCGLGLVSRAEVAEAVVEAKRGGGLLGETLVFRGLLAPETLGSALTRQVVDKLAALAQAPPETQYAFYRNVNTLARWPTAEAFPAHPLEAILAATRAWPDRARIHATLARIAHAPLVVSVAAELDGVGFTETERHLVAQMRAGQPTLLDLQRERGEGDEALASLVYVLAVTRQFAFLARKGLPMGREHGEPRPSGELPDGRISRVSWAPGDTPGASSWPQAASVTPPPVVIGMASTPAPARVEASRPPPPPPPLAPPPPQSDRPARPSSRVRAEVATPDEARTERARQATADMSEAEEALRQGDSATAMRLATRAALADPRNRDARTLVAWLHGLSGKSQATAEALAELTSVLEEEPAHVKALLCRGRLRKRAGKLQEASADFQAALVADPGNREAAGELAGAPQR